MIGKMPAYAKPTKLIVVLLFFVAASMNQSCFAGKIQKQQSGKVDSVVKFIWRQAGVQFMYHKSFHLKIDEDSLVIALLDNDSKVLGPVVVMESFKSFNAANQIFSKEDSVSVIENQRANQEMRVISSWYAYDGYANPKADSIFGDGWSGLAANITCATGDEYGDHRAGGKCYQAVISNGGRALFISTPGERYGIDSVAMRIVNSIRFVNGL